MASIASNPELNAKLPQILIGNPNHFTNSFLASARLAVGEKLLLWKNKTAWNNAAFMVKYLTLVFEVWRTTCPDQQLCVLFDCACCHLTDEAYKVACAAGVPLLVVPSATTAVLQPLDVYVFRCLREDIRRRWTCFRSSSASGAVSKHEWVCLVADAVRNIVSQQSWQHAFEGTGVFGGQEKLGKRLLQALHWAHCPAIAPGLPSLGQACNLFPSRTKVDVDAWLSLTEPADVLERRFIRTID